MVIVVGNLSGEFVDGSVYRYGIFTATIGTPRFGIPDVRVYGNLSADLFPFGIYTHLTQELTCAILAYFRAVNVKQYGKGTSALCILVISIISHKLSFYGY